MKVALFAERRTSVDEEEGRRWTVPKFFPSPSNAFGLGFSHIHFLSFYTAELFQKLFVSKGRKITEENVHTRAVQVEAWNRETSAIASEQTLLVQLL